MKLLTIFFALLCYTMVSCESQKNNASADEEDTTSKSEDTLIIPQAIVSIYLVTDLMMPDGSMKDVNDVGITIEIQSQNVIMGSTGCNRFHGKYTYESGVFSTSGIAATRKMCPENMDVESAFLSYLDTDLNVRLNNRAVLMFKEDALIMKLKKIDE